MAKKLPRSSLKVSKILYSILLLNSMDTPLEFVFLPWIKHSWFQIDFIALRSDSTQ